MVLGLGKLLQHAMLSTYATCDAICKSGSHQVHYPSTLDPPEMEQAQVKLFVTWLTIIWSAEIQAI